MPVIGIHFTIPFLLWLLAKQCWEDLVRWVRS